MNRDCVIELITLKKKTKKAVRESNGLLCNYSKDIYINC